MKAMFAAAALLLTPPALPQQSLKLDCFDPCSANNTSSTWGLDWQVTVWGVTDGQARDECRETCKRCSLRVSYTYTGEGPWYVEDNNGFAQGNGATAGVECLSARCGESKYWLGESGTRPNLQGGASVLLNCGCF